MQITVSKILAENIAGSNGQAGEKWLAGLPLEVEAACSAWDLEFIDSHPVQSFNFIGYARDGKGRPVALKLGFPSAEFKSECEVLGYFGGRGSVNLLNSDLDRGWMLLERLIPGDDLLSIKGETERIAAAANVATKLWIKPPQGHGLPHIRDHFKKLKDRQIQVPELDGLLLQAVELFAEIQDDSKDRLLHGDLHHLNILKRGENWVAIDPKGAIGNPLYDFGAYLLNPLDEVGKPGWAELTGLRINLISEQLGADPSEVAKWGFMVAVLRALWSKGMGYDEWAAALERAKLFLKHF